MRRKCFVPWASAFLISVLVKALWAAPLAVLEQEKPPLLRAFEDDRQGFYLVWSEGQDSPAILRAQHYSPDEKPLWGAEGILVSSAVTSAQDWSGLTDGQGGLTLHWDEATGVRAQRFTYEGQRRRPGNSILLSTSTAIQPDAVADAVGGTLIVWRQPVTADRTVIMAQRADADGRRVWDPGGIRVSLRASHQMNPRVVFDDASGLIVGWRDEANQASELRLQRIDFKGNRLWTLEGIKVMAPVGRDEFPSLLPVGNGSAVVAWSQGNGALSQVVLQKVGPDAALKWGEGRPASSLPATTNQWNPVMASDDRGGIWVAWEDYRNSLNYQIQVNHLNSAGNSVSAYGDLPAGPIAADQGKLAIAADGEGGLWLAWVDNRLATVGIYVQHVSRDGKRLLQDSGRKLADRLTKPLTPQLVVLSPRSIAVGWADRPRKGTWTLSWTSLKTF